MSDSSPDPEKELAKLAKRLRLGWARLYPVTEKNLEGVRSAITAQWNREQELVKAQDKTSKRLKTEKTKSSSKSHISKDKGKSSDKSHSHGRSL